MSTNNQELLHLNEQKLKETFEYVEDSIEIDLCKFDIQTIDPVTFNNCKNLSILSLNENFIRDIDAATFKNCKKLTELFFHKNQLEKIDANAFDNCPNLVMLSLDENRLVNIGKQIFSNCKNLTELYLNQNQIEQLDATIFSNCVELLVLSLWGNHLQAIDVQLFKNCKKLRELYLNKNRIEQIDSLTFESNVNLKILNLEENKLKQVDKLTFKNCKNLNELYLNHNCIEAPIHPSTFEACESLKIIILPTCSLPTAYDLEVMKKFSQQKIRLFILNESDYESLDHSIFNDAVGTILTTAPSYLNVIYVTNKPFYYLINKSIYTSDEFLIVDKTKKIIRSIQIKNASYLINFVNSEMPIVLDDTQFGLDNFLIKKDESDQTLLHYAAVANEPIFVDFYQKHNVSLDQLDKNKHTPFHLAAIYGNIEFIDTFFKFNISQLDQPDKRGQTPLLLAALNYQIPMLNYLLSHNVDVNYQDDNTDSIFHLLINDLSEKAVDTLNFLLKWNMSWNKVDIDIKNKHGQTALHMASYESLHERIYYLCSFDSCVEMLDNQKRTPLQLAILSPCDNFDYKSRTLRALLKCGVDYTKAIEFIRINNQDERLVKIIEDFISTSNEPFKTNNNQMSKIKLENISNMVFQGGSVKGSAYLGAVKALIKNGVDLNKIKRVGGASAGAIAAVLVAVGYSIDEIEDILGNLNFISFIDGEFGGDLLQLKKIIESVFLGTYPNLRETLGNAQRIMKMVSELNQKNGLCPGEAFRNWIEEKIAAKLQTQWITFRELDEKIRANTDSRLKHVFVIGSNISKNKCETFSHLDTPDMVISDAVRISMSIPVLFKPHFYFIKNYETNQRIKDPVRGDDLYVDGGCLDNYPLWLFDNTRFISEYGDNYKGIFFINNETLGLRLVSLDSSIDYERGNGKVENPITPNSQANSLITIEIKNIILFLIKTGMSFFNSDEDYHDKRIKDKQRTIYIDSVGVSILDFDLTKEKVQSLVLSGYNAADKYSQHLNEFNKNFAITTSLLSSLLRIYLGSVELNEQLNLRVSRIDHNSLILPHVIYDFYSKGSGDEIKYLRKFKINLLSIDANGNNVLHLAASNLDIRCIENLKIFNENLQLNELDFANKSKQTILEIIWTIKESSSENLKLNMMRLLIQNGVRNVTNGSVKKQIKANPNLKNSLGKLLDDL